MGFSLYTLAPAWYALVCAAGAVFITWLLYRNSPFEGTRLLWVLRSLRFLGTFLLLVLLMSPFVRLRLQKEDKPAILVFFDRSASVSAADSAEMVGVQTRLSTLQSDFQVVNYAFGGAIRAKDKGNVQPLNTDLGQIPAWVNDIWDGRNVGAVVVLTDGIYNRGVNPLFRRFQQLGALYTIGLGDTVAWPDLKVAGAFANETVFLENDFQLEAQLQSRGLAAGSEKVSLAEDGRLLQTKIWTHGAGESFGRLEFIIKPSGPGVHRYTVSIAGVSVEKNTLNNSRSVYVNVTDTRRRVQLAYHSPHPDVAAIQRALDKNGQYMVKSGPLLQSGDPSQSDLLIVQGAPVNAAEEARLQQWKKAGKPIWYITGVQTQTRLYQNLLSSISVISAPGSVNETQAAINAEFSEFNLSDATRAAVGKWPPLKTPYGTYRPGAGFKVLFHQKIGTVQTAMPLMGFGQENQVRMALLSGEGIWRWRLRNYEQTGEHSAFDEWVSKTLQYLSTEEVKKPFRTHPAQPEFDPDEPVVLLAENYNQNMEPDNRAPCTVQISGPSGFQREFRMPAVASGYRLTAGVLPPGDYTYTAGLSTDRTHSASSRFTVLKTTVELAETRADHNLLRVWSGRHNGRFYPIRSWEKMLADIKGNASIAPVLYTDNRVTDLIRLPWVCLLLALFFGLEWFLRKRNGSY
ncbi:MAG: hypothetical protein JNL57_12615 [Bacteroidetes bacterium]|nr:hypothetical protein [Bacteroidota bacterium]